MPHSIHAPFVGWPIHSSNNAVPGTICATSRLETGRTAQATNSTKPEPRGLETSTGESVKTQGSQKPATFRPRSLRLTTVPCAFCHDLLRSQVHREGHPDVPVFEAHEGRILAEAEQQPHR
jgi:hypothetical protein